MTVVEAVRTIKSVGGRVRPMGDFIRCRVPDPAPPLVDQAVEGELSPEIAFYLGIPDFVFGALSLLAGYLLYQKSLDLKWVLALNIYGFLIIVPGGTVLMNLGIPGPWHVIHSTPDMVSMFEYPMALAPTVVVPIFVSLNGFIVSYVVSRKSALA